MKPAVAKGDHSWVVVPISGAWSAVKIVVAPVLEVNDDSIVVAQGTNRYRVPGAFTARATSPSLKKGDPVMASAKGSRVFGRVVDADADKARVRFKFAGTVEVGEIALVDIVKIDGTPFLGAPIVAKDAKGDRPSALVYAGKDRSWVITGGRPLAVPAADVTVLPAPPALAKGAPVNAARTDVIAPGLVVDVLDEGLQYKVKWDGGEDTATTTFEWVFARK